MKISIIAEGGGVAKGSYVTGAIHALYSRFGLKRVDYAAGSSSSVPTLAYYAAGQLYPGYYLWQSELLSHRFLSFRNVLNGFPYLDIDYLIDHVFKKRIPLSQDKIKKSRTNLFIPLTNFETGEAEYFDNTTNFDFFEILRAAMAVPLAYNKTVKIGPKNYLDGALSDPLPITIPQVRNSRKIIILTNPRNNAPNLSLYNSLILGLFKLKFSSTAHKKLKLKAIAYQNMLREMNKLESNGDIIISPSYSIPIHCNKAKEINHHVKQGYNDTISNPKLVNLIKALKRTKEYGLYND